MRDKRSESASDQYEKALAALADENNSSAIDEFLIIFLVAAKAKGISIFKELGEMNKKESKRLNLAIKFF